MCGDCVTNTNENPAPNRQSELADCFLLIALVATFAHLVQAALQPLLIRFFSPRPELAFCAVLAVFAAMVSAFLAVPALRAIASSRAFAAAALLSLVPAVVLGTLCARLNIQPMAKLEISPWLAYPLRFLFAYDLFRSYWFCALLMLSATGLLVTAVRAVSSGPRKWGLAVSHLSVLLILLGSLTGIFFGGSDNIRLARGESAPIVHREKPSFGLDLRLDGFIAEHYPPRFAVSVFRCLSREDLRHVATISAETPGTSAVLDSGRIAITVTTPPKAAPARHFLRFMPDTTDQTEIELELGGSYNVKGWRFRVLQFLPDFRYDPVSRTVCPSSDEPRNPVVLVEMPPAAPEAGPRVERRWLMANFPGFDIVEGDGGGFRANYVYRRPEVFAVISVARGGGRQETRLPEMQTVFILDGLLALRLDERRDLRDCASEVTVLENGKAARSGTIRINRPFSYGGFTFVQSDFDPTAMGCSEIKVVRHPGLPIVHAGFGLLAAGLVFTLVVARFSRKESTA
jgi:hypothetical protein